jgi:hypothetical protein
LTPLAKLVRARIEELRPRRQLRKRPCPSSDWRPSAKTRWRCSIQIPDLAEWLHDADNATKRALFDAFDLRVVYDKASDRLSISATLTDAVAAMLRSGLEPPRLSKEILRGSDSHATTTLRQDYRLVG